MGEMSMIGMGMYELLIILGLLGGGVGGLPMQPLEAPRDNAWQATAYVLPGSHVAVHGNLEHAWHQIEGLMNELSGLRLVKSSPSALQGLAMGRSTIAQGAVAGIAEAGLDFRKDLGSLTVSVRSDGPERVQILMRARGNFGSDRLAAAIREIAPETEEHAGVTLYHLPERDLPTHVVCIADETTALLGPIEVIRNLLDGRTLTEGNKTRDTLVAAMNRRGARALLWGGAAVDQPGAFLYMAPPAWMIDEMFKETELRHAAAALQGLRAVVHVSVFGRGILTFDATSEKTAALAAHLCRGASRLNAATDPLMDAIFHAAAAVGPLLPVEEVGAEVVNALSDEVGLREAVDWLRLRVLAGTGEVAVDPQTHQVTLEVDSPMGLTSMLVPLSGSLGWVVLARAKKIEKEMEGVEIMDKKGSAGTKKEPRQGPKMPASMKLDELDGGAAPLDARGVPSAVPSNVVEPNRRDLDPGG